MNVGYGKAYHTEFLNVGNCGKFDFRSKSIGCSFQLNVDNVFQEEDDCLVTKVDPESGDTTQYRFRDARRISLTTPLEF